MKEKEVVKMVESFLPEDLSEDLDVLVVQTSSTTFRVTILDPIANVYATFSLSKEMLLSTLVKKVRYTLSIVVESRECVIKEAMDLRADMISYYRSR
jgi:hypothetical protein